MAERFNEVLIVGLCMAERFDIGCIIILCIYDINHNSALSIYTTVEYNKMCFLLH